MVKILCYVKKGKTSVVCSLVSSAVKYQCPRRILTKRRQC